MLTKNRIIIFAQNCLKRIMSQILEFLNVTKESTEEDCHMPIESYQYLIILLRVNQTAKHQEIKYRGVNCRGLNCRGVNCRGLNCRGLNCRGLNCRPPTATTYKFAVQVTLEECWVYFWVLLSSQSWSSLNSSFFRS